MFLVWLLAPVNVCTSRTQSTIMWERKLHDHTWGPGPIENVHMFVKAQTLAPALELCFPTLFPTSLSLPLPPYIQANSKWAISSPSESWKPWKDNTPMHMPAPLDLANPPQTHQHSLPPPHHGSTSPFDPTCPSLHSDFLRS